MYHCPKTRKIKCYDAESLFTNIHIKETINFICDEIYNRKQLKSIYKNLFLRNCYMNLQQNAHLL